jgi:uncharacterized protein (DUF2225 family)
MEEEENIWPKSKTVIQCTVCNRKWFSTDIHRGCKKDGCACGNITLGIMDMTPPTRMPDNFFITIRYKQSYPEIYEVYVNEKGTIVDKK